MLPSTFAPALLSPSYPVWLPFQALLSVLFDGFPHVANAVHPPLHPLTTFDIAGILAEGQINGMSWVPAADMDGVQKNLQKDFRWHMQVKWLHQV